MLLANSLQQFRPVQVACLACIFTQMILASAYANEPPTTSKIDPVTWAESTRKAWRPLVESDVQFSRQKLLAAIQAANRVLDTMPTGGVLRRETELSQLQAILEQDSRDIMMYRTIFRSIARKMPKEAEAVMDEIRKSMWQHIGRMEWLSVTNAPELFEASVHQIQLAMMEGRISPDAMSATSDAYAWLSKSGMVDSQLRQARSLLSHPNEYIRLQSSFVGNLIPKSISKSIPIEQKMEKVRIKGQADVDAKVGVDFIPNSAQGEFQLRMEGTGRIPITASVDKADVHATSNLQLVGKIGIHVKSRGLELGTEEVCVQNKLTLQKVCLHLRSQLLGRALTPLATRILKRLLPKADEKIEEKIKTKITEQLNDSGFAAIVQLNSILNQVLWETVDARDVDTHTQVTTTSEEFLWRDEAILPTTLGAPDSPPGFGSIYPSLQLQLHESALNNTSVVLCRRRYNEVLFRELVYGQLRLRPTSDHDEKGGRIPAAFTFSDNEPLRVRFHDGKLELHIRIQKFEWENQVYTGPERNVTVTYSVQHTANRVLLEQQGEAILEPPTPEDPILQQVLARFFVKQAQMGQLSQAENSDSKIHVVHVSLDQGWLQVGIDNASK